MEEVSDRQLRRWHRRVRSGAVLQSGDVLRLITDLQHEKKAAFIALREVERYIEEVVDLQIKLDRFEDHHISEAHHTEHHDELESFVSEGELRAKLGVALDRLRARGLAYEDLEVEP